jgi:hypothetical protein
MGDVAWKRRVAGRYLNYRATCEDRKGRPHVAISERYVSGLAMAGKCDDGQTMKRLFRKDHP